MGAVEVFATDTERARGRPSRIAELEELAYLDALTGLANRRYLESQLEQRFGEMKRYGWPFGVVLLDIDHFKEVNDRFGHQVTRCSSWSRRPSVSPPAPSTWWDAGAGRSSWRWWPTWTRDPGGYRGQVPRARAQLPPPRRVGISDGLGRRRPGRRRTTHPSRSLSASTGSLPQQASKAGTGRPPESRAPSSTVGGRRDSPLAERARRRPTTAATPPAQSRQHLVPGLYPQPRSMNTPKSQGPNSAPANPNAFK